MAATVPWRRVALYYGLVYAVTYGLLGGFLLSGGSFQHPSWVFFAQATSLTPALLALGLTRWLWRAPVRETLGLRLRRDRWLLAGWLLPWAVSLLALGLGLLVPGTRFDGTLQPAVDRVIVSQAQLDGLRRFAAQTSIPPIVFLVPFGLASSVTLSLVSGCGEEIGWRGFLHGALRPLGFWRGALLTGVLWLGWHLPLLALGYGYPDHPGLGVLLMSVHLLLSSIGYAYLRERAASSVVVGLFHGGLEASLLLAVAPVAGGSDVTVGIGSVSLIGAVVLALAGMVAHDRFVAAEPILWQRRAGGA